MAEICKFTPEDCNITEDVDSVIVACRSLKPFRISPKITIRSKCIVKKSDNVKLCKELRKILPQRLGGVHNFFEFRVGDYGGETIRALFQYVEPEEGCEFQVPNVSVLCISFIFVILGCSPYVGWLVGWY